MEKLLSLYSRYKELRDKTRDYLTPEAVEAFIAFATECFVQNVNPAVIIERG
jgi:hypothetical protein